MIDTLSPLGGALRGLLLRCPPGPRTPPDPVSTPPGFEPPPPLPDDQNGYVALARLVREWPSEGYAEPDLLHRRDQVGTERAAGERALRPLRPLLERLDSILDAPRWQVTVGERLDWPEVRPIRRLGQALLLRAALDGQTDDRERALRLARRFRRAEGPILHFLVGSLMERDAKGSFEGIDEDRREAIHWDIARVVVPMASRLGPWEPPIGEDFANAADERRAIAWTLSGHPSPYDPAGTVDLHLAHRETMETASPEELRRRAAELAAPWPPEMVAPGGFGARAPLFALRRARLPLREIANPYGRLSVAQTLHILGGTVAAIENAQKG